MLVLGPALLVQQLLRVLPISRELAHGVPLLHLQLVLLQRAPSWGQPTVQAEAEEAAAQQQKDRKEAMVRRTPRRA